MQDESDTGDKNMVEGVVQKWLVLFVLFKKNLSKVANLDQKTCKKKTMKEKLGKYSSLAITAGPDFGFFASKTVKWFISSKVVYFMLGFVSEIVFNLFFRS